MNQNLKKARSRLGTIVGKEKITSRKTRRQEEGWPCRTAVRRKGSLVYTGAVGRSQFELGVRAASCSTRAARNRRENLRQTAAVSQRRRRPVTPPSTPLHGPSRTETEDLYLSNAFEAHRLMGLQSISSPSPKGICAVQTKICFQPRVPQNLLLSGV
jgi:hypothetical protein